MEKTKENKKIHYAWFILSACCAIQFAGGGTFINSAGIFFAPVTKELGVSVGKLSAYITILGVFMTIAIPFASKAIAKYNIKLIITLSFIVSLSAVAAMSLFTAVWQWYISGIIIGICSGFAFAVTIPIVIGNWFYKKNGLAIGISSAFAGLGGAILTPVTSIFINQFGWRKAYVLLAVIAAIIVLPFTLFIISFKPEDKGLKPYGYREEEEMKNRTNNLRVTGVAPKNAYKSIAFILLFISLGVFAFLVGYSQLLPSYALSVNLSVSIGAAMVSSFMIGNIISKLFAGALSDKFGIKIVTIVSLIILALSFVILIFSNGNSTIALLGAILHGVAPALNLVLNPIIVRAAFGNKYYGEIFPKLAIGQNLIGAFGITVVGMLYDAFGSYIPTFMLGIALSIISLILVLLVLKLSKNLEWED